MQDFAACKVSVLPGTEPKLSALALRFSNKKTQRIMKLTAFLMLTAFLNVSANGLGQEKITISANNTPLEQVFNSIKKQSGYVFIYQAELLNDKMISVKIINASLQEALDICLRGQKLTYNIVGKSVVISLTTNEKPQNVSSQQINTLPFIDVKGRVLNESGEPVPNVTVAVKGTEQKTMTDSEGEFSLSTVDQNAILVFTHVSMETFELNISGKKELVIKLRTKVSALDNVMVTVNTGYQEVPKERATGSFEKVNNNSINLQAGTTVIKRLEGISSILFDNGGTNRPSATIRGLSTILSSADPLIVVDNFPYEGNINNINPNDVENITILKDAQAASIWGTRAGNGVIVITTKKGKFNRPLKFELNSNISILQKPDLFYLKQTASSDFIDVEQFLFSKGYYTSRENDFINRPALSPVVEILIKQRDNLISATDATEQINALRSKDVRNDFDEYVYANAVNQQYSLNASGGSNNFAYTLSGSFDKNIDELSSRYDRISLRSDNIFTPLKNLQFNLGIRYINSQSVNGQPSYSNYSKLYPYTSLADDYGNPLPIVKQYRTSYIDTAGGGKLLDWHFYPLDDYKHINTKLNIQDVTAYLNSQFKITTWLTIDLRYQYQKQQSSLRNLMGVQSFAARDLINFYTNLSATSSALRNPVPIGDILDNSYETIETQNGRSQVNINKSWNKNNISSIIGAEIRQVHTFGNTYRTYGYNDDIITVSNVDYVNQYRTYISGATAAIPSGLSFTDKTNKFVSVYSNAAYTYDSKYTISGSVRRDASNIFGVNTNEKWTPLWSVGGLWNLSNEAFFHSSILSDLKFRTTYGFSGNVSLNRSAVNTIRYISLPADFTNFKWAVPDQFANPNLRWEKVSMVNIGLDFQLKNNWLIGSFEFYTKKGTDLFGTTPVDYTGVPTQTLTINLANIKGHGFDVNLNSTNIDRGIKWKTTLFYSYNSTKVTKYNLTSNIGSNYVNDGSTIVPLNGKPVYSVMTFRWAGLDSAGNPQGIVNKIPTTNYSAILGDGTAIEDLVYSGPATPPHYGSLINSIAWKGFTLSINVLYKFGHFFKRQSINYDNLFNNAIGHSDFSLRWKNPGDEKTTFVPSLIYPNNSNRDQFYNSSEVLVTKADNIRLQFVNLSYDISGKNKHGKLIFDNLQLYAIASNLGIIWRANKFNIDPEYNSSIPPSKSFTFGMRLNF